MLRSRALWSELELSPIPKLVLQGTRDSYSPLSTLRDLVLQYNECEPQPGPLELQVSWGGHRGPLGAHDSCMRVVGNCRHHHQQQHSSSSQRARVHAHVYGWGGSCVAVSGNIEATSASPQCACVMLRRAVQTVDGADHFFQGRWQVRGGDNGAWLAAGGGRMLSSRRWSTQPVSLHTTHSLPYLSHTCFLLILALVVSLGGCGQGGGLDSAAGRCTLTHVSNSLRLYERVDVLLAGSCGRDIARPSPAVGFDAEQARGGAAAWFGWMAWHVIGTALAGAGG